MSTAWAISFEVRSDEDLGRALAFLNILGAQNVGYDQLAKVTRQRAAPAGLLPAPGDAVELPFRKGSLIYKATRKVCRALVQQGDLSTSQLKVISGEVGLKANSAIYAMTDTLIKSGIMRKVARGHYEKVS